MKLSRKRVVISGMGAITPIGLTLDSIEDSLRTSRSGVKNISLFDTAKLPVRFAGEASDFKAENYLDPKEIRRNDRFIQMCLAASNLAIEDAKLTSERLKSAGVIIGVGLGGLYSIEEASIDFQSSGTTKISPFFIPSILPNLASGQVSIRHGIKGPNFALSSACASGSQAIGQAFREISGGGRDLWIVGGAEAPISPLSIAGFSSARALSKKNETPVEASRPFDKARDGFVLAEGASILVVESLESALARNAPIYAEIKGFGIASDGYHITEPEPTGEGAFQAMEEALRDADISINAIEYVNAHATSTPLGDQVEGKALARIFGDRLKKTFISSTKSLTGHPCGAAGSMEAIFCSLMIDRNFLAPVANLENISDDFKFRSPQATELNHSVQTVMNNSFGFGGINTSMILSRYDKTTNVLT
jgi:3-oxoacyl-[acyl-carrier-protein] synthase II